VSCNRSVKLRELFALANRLGARHVATGHYARVVHEEGRARLHRGLDRAKDQSYFLHMLATDELERLLLPLGDATKDEVRADAVARRLPGAEKGESQELCFVPTGRYDSFVAEHAGAARMRPGPIVDGEGRVVGRHGGIHGFTIGQRKGLGVALGKPAFVVELDAESASVRLGDEAELLSTEARIDEATWSDDVRFPLEADVRVRARHDGERAVIEREGAAGEFVVRFRAPVRAISPGQVAVAYRGDRVLGGGTIRSAATPRAARHAALPVMEETR
jgi:tRNA-specific 2-thiouridylase